MFKNFKNKVVTYLNTVCPITLDKRKIALNTVYIFIFLFLILVILKPSVLNDLSRSSLIEFSFVTSLIFSLVGCVFYLIKNNNTININNWVYKKDILKFYSMLLIGTFLFSIYAFYSVNIIYKNEFTSVLFDLSLVSNIFGFSFFIGTIAYMMLKLFNYIDIFNNIITSKTNFESDTNNRNEKVNKDLNLIKLSGKNKDESIKTSIDNILYLKSYGHYIKVFLKTNNKGIQVKIIRNSLNSILEDFKHVSNFFQCHRSYLVNIDAIEKVKGNSKKATIKLNYIDEEIPVSRVNYRSVKNLCKPVVEGIGLKSA